MPLKLSGVQINFGLIFKLAIYSLIVGYVLYSIRLSPGEIYGWFLDKIAGLWNWLANSGLEYILLGATIVVPLYFLMHLKNRRRD